MRNQKTTIILILSILLTSNGILYVELAKANPYLYYKQVSPPADSKPLNIIVYSPLNNSVYNNNDVTITLNINNQDTSMSSLLNAYLKADWLQEDTIIYKQNTYSPEFPQSWNYTQTFSNIPEGEHNFTIYALGHGMYATGEGGLTANSYTMTSVLTVKIRIDTVPTNISTPAPISTPTPEPEPFPTTLAMASSVTATVVLVGLGLLVYFIKRK
jgi:hypothetical protein